MKPSPEMRSFILDRPAFFLIPHVEPDGDCVGSALALASFLRRIGKRAYLHNLGPFEKADIQKYAPQFAGRISKALLDSEPDAGVIILDCSTLDRIGDLAKDIGGRPVAVIDHHSAGREFGDITFLNPTSPSTSLMVQELIETLGHAVTAEEANLIFFAFCTDTGFFRHLDNRTSLVFPYVERLVAAGASPKDMYLELNSNASLLGRKHLGALLARTESHADGKVLLCWEFKEETEAIGKKNRESDLLYQMLLGIAGVEAVIMLREERKDFITGGLRSKRTVDVGQIALAYGGGGHARASGFGIEGNLGDIKHRILQSVLAAL